MTITIVSMRDAATRAAVKAGEPGWHYVGRAMPRLGIVGSPLGNPYRPGTDGTAAECLAKYEAELRWEFDGAPARRDYERLAALAAIVDDLRAGRAVRISCWCCGPCTVEDATGKCHAAVVAKIALESAQVGGDGEVTT